MPAWYDDDALWARIQSRIFREGFTASAVEQVEQILALAGLPSAARILDMPCGIGRHSIELARRGHRVTAVDRTESYLAQARDKAAAAGVGDKIAFIRSDMREFSRAGAFDLALNIFTSFGYFEDPADDRRVAANYFESLAPGGTLVMELAGKEVLARVFRASDWHEEPDGTVVLEQRQLSPDWSWIENRWLFIKGAERHEFRFGHRLYSAAELTALLHAVGFVDIKVYGGLAGLPYDHKAPRLAVVGKRPA